MEKMKTVRQIQIEYLEALTENGTVKIEEAIELLAEEFNLKIEEAKEIVYCWKKRKGQTINNKYTLTIKIGENPDHDKQPEIVGQTFKLTANTICELQMLQRQFADDNNIGGGNWYFGEITNENGETIGRLSYNGRFWETQKSESELIDDLKELENHYNDVLMEDATGEGGIDFLGETLKNFIDDTDEKFSSLDEVNRELIECGIMPIGSGENEH